MWIALTPEIRPQPQILITLRHLLAVEKHLKQTLVFADIPPGVTMEIGVPSLGSLVLLMKEFKNRFSGGSRIVFVCLFVVFGF